MSTFVYTTTNPRILDVRDADGTDTQLIPVATTLSPPTGGTGAQQPMVPQPAALQGQIYIDPQNVTGVASDTAPPTIAAQPGYSSGGPVYRTFRGLATAWGTISPVLNVNTILGFLSSHTDNTDPVIWTPYCLAGACAVIKAQPVNGASGVLGATGAKNRAAGANTALTTNVPAAFTAAPGNIVLNTTHLSFAWIGPIVAGDSVLMSQPMVGASFPIPTTTPAEVDTWTGGDSVTEQTLVNVNIAMFAPFIVDFNGGLTNFGQIQTLNIFDPGGPGSDCCVLSSVVVAQCSYQRNLSTNGPVGFGAAVGTFFLANCYGFGGIVSDAGFIRVAGGILAGSFNGTINCSLTLDGDVILTSPLVQAGGQTTIGFLCLGANLTLQSTSTTTQNVSYGGHVVYTMQAGAQVILFQGDSRLQTSTTATATYTAPSMITGISFNGGTTAVSHTGASPDVLNNVTTTVAHIDAAAGAAGFGSNGYVWGGCEFAQAA